MDRQIVYPGAIPLETDLLNTNRFTMIAIAKLAASVMGSNTYLNGLACTASSPASMVINIAPGEIYSLQNIDSAAYSSLPADTTHSILKQGIVLNTTSFTLAAPSTAGQSINYLIQVAFQDIDSGATVLPYYNASNPAQAYSGPNNSGIAQNTIRSGVCSVSVKTGVSATTGSQVTPSPDAGYVGAYVVTVNQGQTTITSTSINFAANAPFLPKNGLVSGVQSNTLNYSTDTGTANAYAASYSPAVTQLTDGLRLTFKAKNNNTSSSTFSPNGISSAPIYTRSAGILTGGEIGQNKIIEVEWNSTLNAWTLISGSDPLAVSALQKANNLSEIAAAGSVAQAAAQANIGLTPSKFSGRLLNTQTFTSTGTYTPTAGTAYIEVEAVGGGGASGSLSATGAGQGGITVPGSNGAYAFASFTTGFSSGVSVVIGSGGVGIFGNGPAGGSTAFGTLLSCPGGPGSFVSLAITPPGYTSPQPGPAIPTVTGGTLIKSGYGSLLNPAVILAPGVFTNYRLTTQTPIGTFGLGAGGKISNASAVALIGDSGSSGYLIVREYS
ncbi:phage tail protein [Yersinia enterocolitica]